MEMLFVEMFVPSCRQDPNALPCCAECPDRAQASPVKIVPGMFQQITAVG